MNSIKQTFLIAIAMTAHAIDRAYCESIGDNSVPEWDDAPESKQNSILNGVQMHLDNPDATPEQSHEAWLAQKVAEGWTYGEVKDIEKKQHPCVRPYAELPTDQKSKDYIFRATVHAALNVLNGAVTEAVLEAVGNIKLQAAAAAAPSLPAIPIVSMPAAPAGHVLVQYIGRKEAWFDTLYGSGLSFVKDQVRAVPPAIASQFLRHGDTFAKAEAVAVPASVEVIDSSTDDTEALLKKSREEEDALRLEQNRVLDLKDQVNTMEKDALLAFAFTHFQQRLPANMKPENIRTKIHGLIDQYGVA